MKVLCVVYKCSQFGFIIFWQKFIGAKNASKILTKLNIIVHGKKKRYHNWHLNFRTQLLRKVFSYRYSPMLLPLKVKLLCQIKVGEIDPNSALPLFLLLLLLLQFNRTNNWEKRNNRSKTNIRPLITWALFRLSVWRVNKFQWDPEREIAGSAKTPNNPWPGWVGGYGLQLHQEG